MPQKYIFSIRKLFYLNIFLGYFVFYGQTMVDDAAAAGESFCVFCDFCVTDSPRKGLNTCHLHLFRLIDWLSADNQSMLDAELI